MYDHIDQSKQVAVFVNGEWYDTAYNDESAVTILHGLAEEQGVFIRNVSLCFDGTNKDDEQYVLDELELLADCYYF